MSRLVIAEIGSVVAFVVIAAAATIGPAEELRPIDAAALVSGPAEETWSGIFINDTHVGYSVSRESPTAGGGRVYEQHAVFTLAAMGNQQEVVTGGTAVTDAAGRLERFDFLLSSPVLVVGRGEVRPGVVHVEMQQGGSHTEFDVPVSEPPALSLTAASVIRGKEVKPGDTFELPYFDPITMSPSKMKVTVEAPEMLANGEVGHWLRLDSGGGTTRRLVDAFGATLREEGALGMKSVRMTREEATAVEAGEAPDLIALSKVPLSGFLDPARLNSSLRLRVSGVAPERVPDEPGLQVRDGSVVTLTVPPQASWPVLPVAGSGDTEPTLSLPSQNAEVIARAQEVAGKAPDRATAARLLAEFVYEYVEKVPTIGIPNGLEVLRSRRGDCNEHTALYVSLARALGIPARIAAGLVYNEPLGHAFYYHAWPEVRLGPDESWVPVDPTFGQFPAQATHLKLVTGDLDRQIEIMAVMGQIKLEALPPAPAQPDTVAAP